MESLELVWEEGPGSGFVVTALAHGQMVGRASGRWNGGDSCELEHVEVLEAWRRRWIGRSLVAEVQAHASHVTACLIGEPGARLLRSCGFVAGAEPDAQWSWVAGPTAVGDRDF